jgi:hypothetical protein
MEHPSHQSDSWLTSMALGQLALPHQLMGSMEHRSRLSDSGPSSTGLESGLHRRPLSRTATVQIAAVPLSPSRNGSPDIRGCETSRSGRIGISTQRDKAKLKREIVKAAKKKKRIERELSFAKSPNELQAKIATFNAIQEKLSPLMEFYRRAMEAYKVAEEEEESELMDLLTELL